jgi:outer membrane protein assembly factor BamA
MQKVHFIYTLILCILLSAKTLISQNDSLSEIIIDSIEIYGNDRTKSEIILRELLFQKSDTLNQNELVGKIRTGKENLLKTPLFNEVDFSVEKIDSSKIKIRIDVKERWYLWPEASIYYIDRNFSNWLKEKDWSRLDLGVGVVKYNFRGRNEKLSFFLFIGYDEELYFKYDNFFLDKKRNHALSAELDFKRRKETPYGIEGNRVMQIQLNNEYALKSFSVSLNYTFRATYNKYHLIYLNYENRIIADSVLILNKNYLTIASNQAQFMSLKYHFLIDKRDSRIFPESGYKMDISLDKNGLFLFPESGINSFDINTEISYYTQLCNRLYLNNHIVMKKTFGDEDPFFLNTALGFNFNIRAYEYFAVNGREMIATKNTLNFKILTKRYFNLKFITNEKINHPYLTLYTGIYFDAVYVKNKNSDYVLLNSFQNTLLYGYGIGTTFVTYYDKLLRIEFSTNKQKQSGVYLHFEAPF